MPGKHWAFLDLRQPEGKAGCGSRSACAAPRRRLRRPGL